MKKFFLATLLAFTGLAVLAAEICLTNFSNLAEAQKAGWKERSISVMTVPRPGVLRVQGKDVKRYCGLEFSRVPQLDYSGAIKCKVKMNFGKSIYFAIASNNGYFDIFMPIKPHVEQTLTVPLDIKKWRYRGKGSKPESFGNIILLTVTHPNMQSASEFIEISKLTVPIKDVKKSDNFTLAGNAINISSSIAEYSFSPDNGSLLAVKDKRSGKFAVQGVENHYFLKSNTGDAESFERFDKVVSKNISGKRIKFVCKNDKLENIIIEKIY